jgi:hypothetical protein
MQLFLVLSISVFGLELHDRALYETIRAFICAGHPGWNPVINTGQAPRNAGISIEKTTLV